ncbi:MAG TPA: hypothetical protein PK993_03935 [Clostridia bacterium]|nr:hypothetical protein [Clostridia bacterium]
MANQSNDIVKMIMITVVINLLFIIGNIAYMNKDITTLTNEVTRYTNLFTGPKTDMEGDQITSKNTNYLLSIVDNILNIPILVISFILLVTGAFLSNIFIAGAGTEIIFTLAWAFVNLLLMIWNIFIVKEFIQFFFSRKVS